TNRERILIHLIRRNGNKWNHASNMDLNDLFVEVIREDGAWYKGLVHDFTDEGIEVIFPNTQLPPSTVRYDQVKPVPSNGDSTPKAPEIGDHCEVQLASKDGGTIGWVEGVIKDARGDFFVVDIINRENETSKSDIFPSERIRAINNQEPMSPGCLFRYRVHLNENLEELASDDKSHKFLKEPLSPSRLYYDKNTKELVLLTDSQTCLKRATMMIEMHLKCLDIKSAIIRKSKNALDRIKYSSGSITSRHSCEFQVKESVMGLAIGSRGTNIISARRIPGITQIDTDHATLTFRIYGETEEAVNQARAMLEFEECVVMVPRAIIGRVIGKNGGTIQDIVDRSQILRVKIEGDKDRTIEGEEDKVPLIFTGTVESINNAKILLDFYIAHITEIDELARAYNKLMDEIHKSMPQAPINKTPRLPYQGQNDMPVRGRTMPPGMYRGGNRPMNPNYAHTQQQNAHPQHFTGGNRHTESGDHFQSRPQRKPRYPNPNPHYNHQSTAGNHVPTQAANGSSSMANNHFRQQDNHYPHQQHAQQQAGTHATASAGDS
ncbi:hypothetical protein GJ496_011866, partial [Pomphorhynchus laevis]